MNNVGNIIKTALAATGGAISYILGGWSHLLFVLLVFVIIDYFSGIIAAAIEGRLSSSIGMKGIAKKVFIFALVAVANLVDMSLGDTHVIRDATMFFYLANELLSIIENAGRVGLDIPGPLEKAVGILRDKGEGNR
ncbi:toxin secretion/phage lysis holin [Anaerovirgula multivorans]|uniref:Toxin secretion/phage lysis holin n=1 Tax=Anaerovirgula multivorans TaxID=312168 RepID=A0A238ZUC2_9FIRM|nr:phage holin family protein [Anaerovirgula multivorans]SNR86253.1 toxin secretion/phage lysis holin [Anaerovirgula multivorans]